MKKNSDNLIRFSSSTVLLLVKDFSVLQTNPGLTLEDFGGAKRFNEVLEKECLASFAAPLEKRLSEKVELFEIHNFLTATECDELIPVIKTSLKQGGVTNNANKDPNIRTSKVHAFWEHTQVRQKICDYLGIHPNHGEPMVGQVYNVGEEFKSHCDYFQSERPLEYNYYARQQGGQRTWTFQVYLTDVEEGGETEFPRIGLKVKPEKGKALVWNNLNADGKNNLKSHHASLPVVRGEKVVITQWFRCGLWESPSIEKPTEVEIDESPPVSPIRCEVPDPHPD